MKKKSFGFLVPACVSALVLVLTVACDGVAPKPGPYTISFLPNHGDGYVGAKAVSYGEGCVLPSSGYTREWYVFRGWNTSADGSGTAYANGATVAGLGADLTLYAIWELHPDVIKLLDFEDGRSLEELFDTIVDAEQTVTVQSDEAKRGVALRLDLAHVHKLETYITDAETHYDNFWIAFDYYIQSDGKIEPFTYDLDEDGQPETYTEFPAPMTIPLVLLWDSVAATDTDNLIGTPLYNRNRNETLPNDTGILNSIKTLTTVGVQEYNDRFVQRFTVPDLMSRWVRVKYHVVFDGEDRAGIELYVDGVDLDGSSIKCMIEDKPLPDVDFNMLRLWYHTEDTSKKEISATNTNLYLDNIGVFSSDPDAFQY